MNARLVVVALVLGAVIWIIGLAGIVYTLVDAGAGLDVLPYVFLIVLGALLVAVAAGVLDEVAR